MNADFPRILTLLRKERGMSQKQAAAELQISQALLSHYEKGIRECGLDFVVRAANFYGVSCDYLLGRSPDRNGATLQIEDIPESDAFGRENNMRGNILAFLNKKLIINAVNIIFDLLQKCKSKDLINQISGFLNLSVYRSFRILYSANPKNVQNLFSLPPELGKAKASADMTVQEALAMSTLQELRSSDPAAIEALFISTDTLSKEYPLFCSSLLNLIKNTENSMNQ